jgi:hypothetical protein
MVSKSQDPEVRGSLYDKLCALVMAGLFAGLSFLAMMLVVVAFSATGCADRRFGDEGSAWLGVSVGLPLSFIVAIVTFLITLKWRLKKSLED